MNDNGAPDEATGTAGIGQLAAALAKAQASFGDLVKGATAKVGAYSYDYATLADCLAAIVPALGANGIALIQPTAADEGHVKVTTILAHESGEWFASTLTMPVADNKPQSIGSAITYGRRYGLCSMVGIAPDEDDDGNAAQGQKAETASKAQADLARWRGKIKAFADQLEASGRGKILVSGQIVDKDVCDLLQADPPIALAALGADGLERVGKHLKKRLEEVLAG